MKRFVFLGPSLPVGEARSVLDAVYLPPVAQGDVLRVLDREPDVIGIVDGYFDKVPSVWHKEILVALSRGVRVYGAASMGALRAAELQRYGMAGVGRIFEWYRDGVLEDDDEVAILHGPAESGYPEFSEAMVNIRDACRVAREGELVPAGVAGRLVEIAKGLHYRDRSWPRVLERARAEGLDEADLGAFERFLHRAGPSLKRRDARLLLETIAALPDPLPPAEEPRFHVERTTFLESLEGEVRRLQAARLDSPVAEETVPLFGGQSIEVLKKKVLLQILALREAERLGMTLAPEEHQEEIDAFRRRFSLESSEAMAAWLAEMDLSAERFAARAGFFALVEKLVRHYEREIERGLPDMIRIDAARLRNGPGGDRR